MSVRMSLDESAILRAIARSSISLRHAARARRLMDNLEGETREVAEVLLGDRIGNAKVARVADWFRCAARSDLPITR